MEKDFETWNPFWDNHLFTKEDLKRTQINWQEKIFLWFLPMKVQISTDGDWYYKVWNGKYYFLKYVAPKK